MQASEAARPRYGRLGFSQHGRQPMQARTCSPLAYSCRRSTTMLRAAGQAARRAMATSAASEAHTGLVEMRAYDLKPEGIKARPRIEHGPLVGAQETPLLRRRRRPRRCRRSSPASAPTPRLHRAPLQEFMRLTNEKLALRKSLLPFLGCARRRPGLHDGRRCPPAVPSRPTLLVTPALRTTVMQHVHVRHGRRAVASGALLPRGCCSCKSCHSAGGSRRVPCWGHAAPACRTAAPQPGCPAPKTLRSTQILTTATSTVP